MVTIFNEHKPRNCNHYERFEQYPDVLRGVEAASVTPFSRRAPSTDSTSFSTARTIERR